MKFTNLARTLILLPLLHIAVAQEEMTEPAELTKLRDQFRLKVDQEIKPWRERYGLELQKLEDIYIRDRKLNEALIVKNEKESYLNDDSSKKSSLTSSPDTAAKTSKMMTGSVWLVYAAEDKKRENLLDTYHFFDSENVFVLSSKKKFFWNTTSAKKAKITFMNGDITLAMDFKNHTGTSLYQEKKYTIYLAGKVPHEP